MSLILKYYNENADVVAIEVTDKDVQKFFDDYFDSAQKLHMHPDRDGTKLEDPQPADVALYNALTDGLWQFNGPLRQIAQIHQLHVDQAAAAKAAKPGKHKSIREIIAEEVRKDEQ